MIKTNLLIIFAIIGIIAFTACEQKGEKAEQPYQMRKYAKVQLTADLSHLSDNQKDMLKLLFKAADLMNDIFWVENVEEKDAFMLGINNEKDRQYALINYGPWDEMNNLAPFIVGYGDKPAGAQFQPSGFAGGI